MTKKTVFYVARAHVSTVASAAKSEKRLSQEGGRGGHGISLGEPVEKGTRHRIIIISRLVFDGQRRYRYR